MPHCVHSSSVDYTPLRAGPQPAHSCRPASSAVRMLPLTWLSPSPLPSAASEPARPRFLGHALLTGNQTRAEGNTGGAQDAATYLQHCGTNTTAAGTARAGAHLLHNLLLLDQERADDPLAHHLVVQVAAIDAVHGLVLPRQPLVAHLLRAQRGNLRRQAPLGRCPSRCSTEPTSQQHSSETISTHSAPRAPH